MRQAVAGTARGIEVITAAVAPRSGPMQWNRYRPETLSGPLEAAAWRALYPRLAVGPVLEVEGTAIGDLLRRIAPQARPGRRHLLVLDVAGQERSLLEAIEPASLREYDLVVVRGLRDAGPGRPALAEALAKLDSLGFVARGVAQAAPTSAWVVHTLAFDKEKHRQQQRDQRLQELERTNSEQVERLAKQTQELTALRTARDEQAKLATERAASIAQLEKEATRRGEECATLQSQLADSIKSAAEHQKGIAERDKRVQKLEAELSSSSLRQRLLDDELARAEGQLEVIKLLLLRETSL